MISHPPGVNIREAKVIAIPGHTAESPQIPKPPLTPENLQLHTLEIIDKLLDEHFK